MGADVGDETKAIEELKGLSKEARRYLSHHFRNSILTLMYASRKDEQDVIDETFRHMIRDLERIGC